MNDVTDKIYGCTGLDMPKNLTTLGKSMDLNPSVRSNLGNMTRYELFDKISNPVASWVPNDLLWEDFHENL
jgi:hypothetical protein